MSENMWLAVTAIYFFAGVSSIFEGAPWMGGMFFGWAASNVCAIVHMFHKVPQ
jgi:hypothetical protein